MHIIQVLPQLNEGGVERGTLEFNRAFVERGHRSTVISSGGRLATQIDHDGGRHIQMDVASKNPFSAPIRVWKLRSLLAHLNPDILHARSRVPAWLCWFANSKGKLPFITTVHGFNSPNPYSRIMTKGDHVICVSHSVRDYIQTHYAVPDKKITVIHRGVDPKQWDPGNIDSEWIRSFTNEFGLQNKRIITSVGRITELKDFETFIRAIVTASRSVPNIVGLIVGSAQPSKESYFQKLKALVEQLNAGERIRFAGSQTRLPEIYSISRLLVSCSKKPESFGRTLIEAMAMNTPVMATRHGGALDIIQNTSLGTLFDVGDVDALARGMVESSQLPVSGLRSYVIENFSLTQMIDKTLGVYITELARLKNHE